MASESTIFDNLVRVIAEQQALIKSISEKLQKLELNNNSNNNGGSTQTATLVDYTSNTEYTRNMLVVDTDTETVYRVLTKYTSVDVDTDCRTGNLKLVGFESQVVTLDHNPTQSEIESIPEDALVAIYSSTDTPYAPDILD